MFLNFLNMFFKIKTDISNVKEIFNLLKGFKKEEGANLKWALLEEAQLEEADLYRAQLEGAHLQGANLKMANLKYAILEGANLQGAYLQGANLQGANLHGANLEIANLREAHLERIDLSEAKYDDETKWAGATYNTGSEGTKWPDGFEPEEHGCINKKDE